MLFLCPALHHPPAMTWRKERAVITDSSRIGFPRRRRRDLPVAGGLGRMPRSTYLGLFIAGLAAVLVGRASAACDVEVYVAIDASSAAAEASAFEIYASFVQEVMDVANSFCIKIGETGRSARLGVTALRCDEDATLGVELLKPTPKARNIQKALESFPDVYPGTGVCGELALAKVESYATKKANLNRRQRLLVLSDTPFYNEDSQEMGAHLDALEKAGVQVINVFFSSNSTGLMQVATTMTRLYMTSIDELEPSDLGLYLPTQSPTLTPTLYPTMRPTPNITASPTMAPSTSPTLSPSGSPTLSPTLSPTRILTSSPTQVPTAHPTVQPTLNPTRAPSASPTAQTSLSLTPAPTPGPLITNSSDRETLEPTMSPSKGPSTFATVAPSIFFNETTGSTSTSRPSFDPTQSPTTKVPTQAPTRTATPAPSTSPTRAPTQPTSRPTDAPTDAPSRAPSLRPTRHPSTSPTMLPTQSPTDYPTQKPTSTPTNYPSKSPTSAPTEPPVPLPTLAPTLGSTPAPSQSPTTRPTQTPLQSDPTKVPSPAPTSFVATGGGDSTRSPTKAPTEPVVEQPSSSPTGHSATLRTRTPTATPTLMPSAAVNETEGSVPDGNYSDELGVCPKGSYDSDGECFFVWDRNGNGRVLVYIICASLFLPVLLALGSLGWVGLDISLDVVASTGDLMTDIFYLTQEPYFNALLFGLSCTSVALTVLPYMLWLKRNPVRLHFGNAMLIRTERTLLLLIGSIAWWTVGFFLYAMKVLPFGRVKRTFLLDPDSGFLCGVARAWLQRINARIRGRPDSPAPRVRIEDPPFDPAAFNRMRLLEVAVESVPQFSVQLANGLLLNSWSVASALSLGFSGFLILRVVQQLIVYVAVVGRSPDELPVGLGLFVEPVSTATMAIAQTQKRRQHRRRKTNKAVNPRQGLSPEEASQDQGNPVSEAVDETSSPTAQAVTPQPPNTPKSTSGTEMTQV